VDYKGFLLSVMGSVLNARNVNCTVYTRSGVSMDAINPDAYTMTGECPTCKVKCDLHCSKQEVLSGEPVEVYSAFCDHHWTLSKEQSEKLRNHLLELKR
jgi:transcription elongation factor Elf1